MTHIKASPDVGAAGKHIPDFMMLEPSEQQQQYELYKKELLDKLKPTEDMVAKITANAELAAGWGQAALQLVMMA